MLRKFDFTKRTRRRSRASVAVGRLFDPPRTCSGGSRRSWKRASAANPSVLCGEQIETETDVLYVQKMPTFDGSLGAADAELVCSYLTAPVPPHPSASPVLLGAGALWALGCVEMQSVLTLRYSRPARRHRTPPTPGLRRHREKRHNAPSTAPAPKEKLIDDARSPRERAAPVAGHVGCRGKGLPDAN